MNRIFSILVLFFICGCDTKNQYHNLMYTENKFKVHMQQTTIPTFIVWPESVRNMPIQENNKFIKILKNLGSFHDVSIMITPTYDTKKISVKSINERCFYVRELLLEFGVNANRITIAKIKKPIKLERGINIKIVYYKMGVPNCDTILQKQTQPIEYPLANFGCATAANFGKMVAYPSSIVEYKPTELYDKPAIDAAKSYIGGGNDKGGGY